MTVGSGEGTAGHWREMRAAGPSTLPGALQDRLGVLPGGTRSLGAQSPSLEAIWAGGGDAAVVWDRKGAWGSGGLLLVTGHPARGAGAAACPQVGLPDGEPDAKAGLSSERRAYLPSVYLLQ